MMNKLLCSLLLCITAVTALAQDAEQVDDKTVPVTSTADTDLPATAPGSTTVDPNYTPTEEISDDLSVSFPVDI